MPKSGRKSDPPSGLAADALSRSAFGLAFSNSLFFAFVPLWRVLERGGEAAALVYSSTRLSAICICVSLAFLVCLCYNNIIK